MKFVARGAEAEIYEVVHDGRPAILKRRARKAYRLEQLDARIRLGRTKREARAIAAVKRLGVPAPLLYSANLEKCELVMQKIEGRLLREQARAGPGVFGECGMELGLMHSQGVVHGDFSSSNVIVRPGGGVVFFDFGLSSFSDSAEEQATDLLVFKRSVGERQYAAFLAGYLKGNPKSATVLRQAAEIEKRGRYVARAQASG